MPRLLLLGLVLIHAVTRLGAADPAPGKTHAIHLNGHVFTLPSGFEIELVAGPPLVNRPITTDFDEQGRLYVGDSSGSNEKVEVQLEKKPHRIVRLEDTDGDGKFDKSVGFADKMMFPEGTMWHAGSLYVAAPPSIWKLTDTDGDGVADQRVEWFQGKTLTGCANDLHGPYLGLDGMIYWCKGAFAKQTYGLDGEQARRRKGQPFTTRAAHIFRARPDGTSIEPVMTGGMDNPVDVVFMPNGERIFTTTFLQHPGGGNRDGLIHAIYGGIYGKDHDPIYEHPWTGPALMPVLSHLGPAAPSGLCRYESAAFGKEYQDNLFAALFNLHKITRHLLTPHGATYRSKDEDFLVSNNLDFHPTDVLEDADGSLLVVDTGGWYKLCCPTSQLVKPDVLGAIYRVRRKGAPQVEDPRGKKLAWSSFSATWMTRFLDDPRPAVRHRAVRELAAKGADALPGLVDYLVKKRGSVEGRRNMYWTTASIAGDSARIMARQGFYDADEGVRSVAIQAAGLWRDPQAVASLCSFVKKDIPPNQRAAAEALGRIGDKKAVPTLLDALGATDVDPVLRHSLIFALIEIGDREGTAIGMTNANPAVRRGALIALDQMAAGKPALEAVLAELAAPDAALKEAAWWIASRHHEWGDALGGVLRERLGEEKLSAPDREELGRQLAKLAKAPAVQMLLAQMAADANVAKAARQTTLRAMAQAGLRNTPALWPEALATALASPDAEVVAESVAATRALRLSKPQQEKLTADLLAVAGRRQYSIGLRISALAALPAGPQQVETPLFDLLLEQLGPEQPVGQRTLVADVLAKSKLSSDQLGALTGVLAKVGPMELDRLVDAFAACTDDAVGVKLLAALKAAPARSNLRVDTLKQRLAKFGPSVQQQAAELYALLETDTAQQRAKLEELLARVKEGDVRRGQVIFHGQKAACFACHAIGYRGGTTGPDLTRIGGIRTERDLLESIVFPNASLVRSYESVLIATKDGKVINGLIRKETPEELLLATGANQEVRVLRDDIEALKPSAVSIMPAGLDQQLTVQELADLIAFLKACR